MTLAQSKCLLSQAIFSCHTRKLAHTHTRKRPKLARKSAPAVVAAATGAAWPVTWPITWPAAAPWAGAPQKTVLRLWKQASLLTAALSPSARELLWAGLGATAALCIAALLRWVMSRYDDEPMPPALYNDMGLRRSVSSAGAPPYLRNGRALISLPPSAVHEESESVEWVNMVLRKVWYVYQRNLERWLVDILQPAIDSLSTPAYVRRVVIAGFTLAAESATFRNMQRKSSRQANDLQYHLDLRYTGGAKASVTVKLAHPKLKALHGDIPIDVYDLDVDAQLWVRLRLSPVSPWVSNVSLAFVSPPKISIKLAPFGRVNLMSIPFISSFLSKLLTEDLPAMFIFPKCIRFDIKPTESAVAAAMVANGGKQLSAMPPPAHDSFVGELSVTLREARGLPTVRFLRWGRSDPYCVLSLGTQVRQSKRNTDTSFVPANSSSAVWNQSFSFLVEDPREQMLTIRIRDAASLNLNIGFLEVEIKDLEEGVVADMWFPLQKKLPSGQAVLTKGQVRLELEYKSFVEEAPQTPVAEELTDELGRSAVDARDRKKSEEADAVEELAQVHGDAMAEDLVGALSDDIKEVAEASDAADSAASATRESADELQEMADVADDDPEPKEPEPKEVLLSSSSRIVDEPTELVTQESHRLLPIKLTKELMMYAGLVWIASGLLVALAWERILR
eukprot:jgi/Chlat1/4451/Chrsp29S04563